MPSSSSAGDFSEEVDESDEDETPILTSLSKAGGDVDDELRSLSDDSSYTKEKKRGMRKKPESTVSKKAP